MDLSAYPQDKTALLHTCLRAGKPLLRLLSNRLQAAALNSAQANAVGRSGSIHKKPEWR